MPESTSLSRSVTPGLSTIGQDLNAQRDSLERLGVQPARIYVDHGLTGTTRDRPGLREALAACRAGDELVVTKVDRMARSIPDARDISAELIGRRVAELAELFSIGRSTVYRALDRSRTVAPGTAAG